MASLLAASRQDLAAAYGLHTRTETVRFGAAAFARLICALWQSNPPISTYAWLGADIARRKPRTGRLGGEIRIIKFTGAWQEGSRKGRKPSDRHRQKILALQQIQSCCLATTPILLYRPNLETTQLSFCGTRRRRRGSGRCPCVTGSRESKGGFWMGRRHGCGFSFATRANFRHRAWCAERC